VFNLYAVEGYTHNEIGEMLGISEGTSKSQFSRARLHLQQLIEKTKQQEIKAVNYEASGR
jgi:RNA polymerase sigma-70 factor (ECF subfamily)